MRLPKLLTTMCMLLGITSGIGAYTHGNSLTGSIIWFFGWLTMLIFLNVVE